MAAKRKSVEEDDQLEQRHFQNVIDTFMYYQKFSTRQLERKMKSFESIPTRHQAMVPTLATRLNKIKDAIDANYDFIKQIIEPTQEMFMNSDMGEHGRNELNRIPVSSDGSDRVRTTLKQFVRDWSKEGKPERKQCYEPISKELEILFPAHSYDRSDVSILIPGAGLGRLMYDIASLGFTCQGNEFSLYMLFASNYILNVCTAAESVTIYPWIHNSCNIMSNNDQLREVRIPDVLPQLSPLSGVEFSMAAGDFLDIYTEPERWDCVAMCFFLDTAHNVIDYIEKVYHILKPGGYFVNLGPLLYHFAGVLNEPSIELTYEEIKDVMLNKFQFNLISEKTGIRTSYIENPLSMMKMEYECVLFVVQKPLVSCEE